MTRAIRTVAVVPVKGLAEAKSRLAGILSPAERAELVRDMLRRVLYALQTSGAIDAVGVISPDPDELSLPPGVAGIRQEREGLNNLLRQGREWAIKQGAGALLIIFADLPLLSPGDISLMVRLGVEGGERVVVLAPDRHGAGTNALLSRPAGLARFAFGQRSLEKHEAMAREVGAEVRLFRSTGTMLDIDTLDDLAYLEAHRQEAAMQYAFGD